MAESTRRRFKNFLLDPNFQIKYALYFAASGLAVMSLMFGLFTFRLNHVLESMPTLAAEPSALESTLYGLIYDISLFTLLAFAMNVVLSFCFALFMTHRVVGPAHVIESYIRDLQSGNYDSKRTLRKSDDLQAVMASLRDLGATLKAKDKRP